MQRQADGFSHKVQTLCYVSLVVSTTGENDNFRNKAKCAYIISLFSQNIHLVVLLICPGEDDLSILPDHLQLTRVSHNCLGHR